MHIALGYHYFAATTGYHLERALRGLGHTVTYVGPPAAERLGYAQNDRLDQLLASLSPPPDCYWWIDSGGPYFPMGIEELSIPSLAYLVDVHIGHWRPTVAGFFDAVFYAQKDFGPRLRQAAGHDQVYWLPLAAAPDLHHRLELPPLYDVAFVGNINLAHRGTARERRLRQLAARYRTNDFFRPYPPEALAQVYSQSRLVCNISLAGDVNMRVFEATACGSLLLTDAIGNGLDELFEVGHELVTYTDDADLFDRADYYLAHEAERAAIAAAGHRRTHAGHTYAHRAQQVLTTLSAPDFQRLAPMRRAGPRERWHARRRVYTHLHMLEALAQGARAASRNPLRRAWDLLPGLLRSLRV